MSPAKNQLAPNSTATRIRQWLAVHPGHHRAYEVADGLEVYTKRGRQEVANVLGRLARSGDIVRHRVSVPDRRVPVSTFGYTQPPQE